MGEDSELKELHVLEHNLQNLLMQKQAISMELNEVANALSEVESSQDEIYKITGQIMLKSDKESVLKELKEKKHILELRNQSVEKQEAIFKAKADEIKKSFQKRQKAG